MAGGAAQICEAEPGDLGQCADIVNDWIDESEFMPRIYSREKIASFFSPGLLESRQILVAENSDCNEGGDARIVGYLSVDHDRHIHALYLRPDARGRGIGSALMEAARESYPNDLQLNVHLPNLRAQKFYKRHGFVEIDQVPAEQTDEGVAELRMRWAVGQ